MKRKKTETAGRLVSVILYTAAMPHDTSQIRKQRAKSSTAVRQILNHKASWQKLETLLACNFSPGDLAITLTYRDDALPRTKAQAVTRVKRFIRLLRESRRIRGDVLRYVYCTEGYHGDHRWHHHLIINSTGADFEEVRAMWADDGDDVDIKQLNQLDGLGPDATVAEDYRGWAIYLTKEAREHGSPRVGERMWTPSKGMLRPIVENSWCGNNETLSLPPGAFQLESSSVVNEFGSFDYIRYILPTASC